MPGIAYSQDFRDDGRLVGRLEVRLEDVLDRADVYRVVLQDEGGEDLINDVLYWHEITPRQIDQPSATRHRPDEFDAPLVAYGIMYHLTVLTEEPRVLTDEVQETAWDLEDIFAVPDDDELPNLVIPERAKLWAVENANALSSARTATAPDLGLG